MCFSHYFMLCYIQLNIFNIFVLLLKHQMNQLKIFLNIKNYSHEQKIY